MTKDPSQLEFECVDPDESVKLFDYLNTRDESLKESAEVHLRLCHHCQEAVVRMKGLEGIVSEVITKDKATAIPALEFNDALRLTEFVVEASSFERHTLWERFATEAKDLVPRTNEARIDWHEQSRGWLLTVGRVHKRPVCLSLSVAMLNRHLVLFYEATSEIVDWKQIEAWFKENCWPLWDHGTRRAHCNAMNFHHCLEVCRTDRAALSSGKE